MFGAKHVAATSPNLRIPVMNLFQEQRNGVGAKALEVLLGSLTNCDLVVSQEIQKRRESLPQSFVDRDARQGRLVPANGTPAGLQPATPGSVVILVPGKKEESPDCRILDLLVRSEEEEHKGENPHP